ncbi:hypothetical protein IX51_08255 [uncultured archaeon]|nr:hypothetical protein IX51_08255 [uncultured archaeon]
MRDFDTNIYYALKVIKTKAGPRNHVSISSSDLAEGMGLSQQSASRILIRLVEDGYITRTFQNRKQRIVLTDAGLDVLYRELGSLSKILHLDSTISLSGIAQSGLGEGRYYISRKFYIIQFQEKLGFIPYLGTLNLKILPAFESPLRRLRSSPGIHIDGFKTEDRTFGPVKVFNATVNGEKCAVIFPERSVYTDVVELISEKYLRGEFGLKDGDAVDVSVDLSQPDGAESDQ